VTMDKRSPLLLLSLLGFSHAIYLRATLDNPDNDDCIWNKLTDWNIDEDTGEVLHHASSFLTWLSQAWPWPVLRSTEASSSPRWTRTS